MEDHPHALEYDWRVRFDLPLRAVFDGTITWREAYSLTLELLRDPTSHLAAAVAGWRYPWSREAAALADLYDLLVVANTDRKHRGRIEPYPRPFEVDTRQVQRSAKPTVDQTTIRAALAELGH